MLATAARTRWIPPGSRPHAKDGVPAIVYLSEGGGSFYALGYSRRRTRHSFNYSFRTEASRDTYVDQFFVREASSAQIRNDRAAQRASFFHSMKVGNVLVHCWGYDQTNVDFFEVVAVPSGKSVRIRPIADAKVYTDSMQGTCTPCIGSFTGEAVVKRVARDNYIAMKHHRCLHPWDGKPVFWSSYG